MGQRECQMDEGYWTPKIILADKPLLKTCATSHENEGRNRWLKVEFSGWHQEFRGRDRTTEESFQASNIIEKLHLEFTHLQPIMLWISYSFLLSTFPFWTKISITVTLHMSHIVYWKYWGQINCLWINLWTERDWHQDLDLIIIVRTFLCLISITWKMRFKTFSADKIGWNFGLNLML